jgi:hypothetical protein
MQRVSTHRGKSLNQLLALIELLKFTGIEPDSQTLRTAIDLQTGL